MELLIIMFLVAAASYLFKNNNSQPISGTYYYYDSSETKYTHRTFNGKDVSNNSEYDEVFSKFDNHFKK